MFSAPCKIQKLKKNGIMEDSYTFTRACESGGDLPTTMKCCDFIYKQKDWKCQNSARNLDSDDGFYTMFV